MLGLLLAIVAPQGFVLQQHTSRADWYVTPGLYAPVRECEKFLEATERQFQVNVPHFTYSLVPDTRAVEQHTGVSGASGVADPHDNAIVSREPCSKHEIVHLVIFQAGAADMVFQEGLATMFANDYGWYDRWLARLRVRRLMLWYQDIEQVFLAEHDDRALWRDSYLVADGWVRHLVKQYGMAAMVRFLNETRTDADNTHAAFQKVYGQDLDQAFFIWLYGQSPSRK